MTNAILLDERDNVATCTSAAVKGTAINILGGDEIVCVDDIPTAETLCRVRTLSKNFFGR